MHIIQTVSTNIIFQNSNSTAMCSFSAKNAEQVENTGFLEQSTDQSADLEYNIHLVLQRGLEPRTPCLKGRCSTS